MTASSPQNTSWTYTGVPRKNHRNAQLTDLTLHAPAFIVDRIVAARALAS